MIKTYYATSNTGTPLLGKSFILKDRANALADVPMTELGAGHYTADLAEGTAWNVYEGTTNTGVVVDALLANGKEPIISAGNSAHAYFGSKVFRQIQMSDVSGLNTSLAQLSNQITQNTQAITVMNDYINDLRSPTRTFDFGGKTYSVDPITVMTLQGYREDGAIFGAYAKAKWIVTEPNEVNPYFNVSIPGDGSWVDAFRIKQYLYEAPKGFFTGFSPTGLLHNLQSVFSIPYIDADGAITQSLDFRFSLLANNPYSDLGYTQIGQSIIGKMNGTFRYDAGGAERLVAHSVREIGAQIPVPGVQTKIKIEVRLKVPSAPLVLECNGGTDAQLHGQLYPEVL